MKNDPQPMKNEEAKQAEQIYFAAIDIEDTNERSAFIEAESAGNDAVREKVQNLFSLQNSATRIFELCTPSRISVVEISNTLNECYECNESTHPTLLDNDEEGKQVGNYKLLQKIGEGGVGNVYLAEQIRPVRRRVALKIIKAGMDSKNVIARFEAERQALAMMEHPNIAQVLNAGTTETGRPFFVMELVHGERITTYCDKHRLGIRQRLELFIQVCHAIQHAHQKGIVHRDIKPSNVLITLHDGIPRPVVIDFGIAKATSGDLLTDKTVNTSIGPLIGTPAYMSPEQTNLAQMDIDTRSDIYSLGVLLYELLTGQTPFNHKELLKTGLDEMIRIIREVEPSRPSITLQNMDADLQDRTADNRSMDSRGLFATLAADLDWIVMMALEKDRANRYETANALAVDIECFLHDEPVMACPPSQLYRFRKLLRRNKRFFATAAVISLTLIIGFGMSSWFLIKEREARKRAVLAEQRQSRLRLEAEDRERIAHAAFLLNQNRIEEADQLIARIATEPKPSLEAESVLRTLGEWHALKGQWVQAANYFDLLMKVDIKNNSIAITSDLLMGGPILIECGDMQEYERFRRAAIERYRGTKDPVLAERTLKISLLVPADEQVMHSLQPFADFATDNTQGPTRNSMMAWRCVSLALMAYRQGYYPTAIAWCQRSRSLNHHNPPRIATTHIIQAMAHDGLEETEQADSELSVGREMIKAGFSGGLKAGNGSVGFWYDWLFARILLREAEKTIK